jgi:NADPH:quinone reductase-like Zn-dependent oxidoreductase
MKAVRFDQHGEPASVLRVEELPLPAPGWGEVRVRMVASPINPSDVLLIEGRYGLRATLPATPGFEGVGIVEESGGGLLGWLRKGKRVAVLGARTGTWAEAAIASARQVIPVPDSLSDEQAATFFINPATAILLVTQCLKLPRGAWLLQTAAGSSLGKMIIQLGQVLGFQTINVVRRREQAEELKRLGADVVLVAEDGPLREQLRAALGLDGVTYAIDAVGGDIGSQAVECLADGGELVLYGLLSREPICLDPRTLITGSKSVRGFWLADWAKNSSLIQKLRLIRRIRRFFRSGTVQTEVAKAYPLADVNAAVAHAAKPGKGGKILLRFSTSE